MGKEVARVFENVGNPPQFQPTRFGTTSGSEARPNSARFYPRAMSKFVPLRAAGLLISLTNTRVCLSLRSSLGQARAGLADDGKQFSDAVRPDCPDRHCRCAGRYRRDSHRGRNLRNLRGRIVVLTPALRSNLPMGAPLVRARLTNVPNTMGGGILTTRPAHRYNYELYLSCLLLINLVKPIAGPRTSELVSLSTGQRLGGGRG
jgi:hypothetical protein